MIMVENQTLFSVLTQGLLLSGRAMTQSVLCKPQTSRRLETLEFQMGIFVSLVADGQIPFFVL